MTKWRSTLVIVALSLVLAGALLYPTLRQPSMPESATYFTPARMVNDFTLQRSDGTPFTRDALLGHWSFVFIGYTFCPDICPTTLSDLRGIYPELKRVDERSQVIFVSVDPQRDDMARLTTYTQFFNPEFVAVSGSQSNLFPFVRNLGLVYSIVDEHDAKNYLVDHSASIVLINPKGEIQAVFRPDMAPGQPPRVSMAKMASDFAKIRTLALAS